MSIIEKAVAKLERSGSAGAGTPQPDLVDFAGGRHAKNVCKFDYGALRSSGYLVEEDGENQMAEQYRRIKRPVLRNAFNATGKNSAHPPNLIVVTSACPGEGKTFNSLNLALAMAQEKDLNVLLVDGDVVKAQLSHLIGLNGEAGLTDLLKSDAPLMINVVVDTNVDGLHVLPAGNVDQYSTELLSSKKMEQLLRELLRVYNDSIIIFDAPPIMSASQANVLCELAGQIIMVVEAGKTPRSMVKEAVNTLDRSKPIGLILNKDTRFDSGYYGAYYERDEAAE